MPRSAGCTGSAAIVGVDADVGVGQVTTPDRGAAGAQREIDGPVRWIGITEVWG